MNQNPVYNPSGLGGLFALNSIRYHTISHQIFKQNDIRMVLPARRPVVSGAEQY